MAKKTMQAIADELNVARSAVSRALSGKKGVSEQTRRRIIAAARRHGYVPRPTPAPISAQIVLLAEERTLREKIFWSYVTNGLVAEVPLHNGFLSIAVTEAGNPVFALPPLLEQAGKVDGVVAMAATDIRAVRAVKGLGLPVVLVDYDLDCPGFDSVIIDDRGGTFQMTMELIELGHRKFGYAGGIKNPSYRRRYEGMVSALIQSGIQGPLPPRWHSPEDLPARDLPTAIFCCNDDNAARTIEILAARGIRIPGDVSVVGFDDSPSGVTGNCPVPLTTLHVDKEELGRWAIRTLFQRLNNPDGPPIQVTVSVTPMHRQSCAKPRQEGWDENRDPASRSRLVDN